MATVRVALDGMGGDHAPSSTVGGAVDALRSLDDIEIVLVGHSERLREEISRYDVGGLPIDIYHAPETIEMHENPTDAYKKKRNSSMIMAIQLVKEGKADAVISAGNTGALTTAVLLDLGRLPGIDRPAIASPMPTVDGVAILIDAGANADCKAGYLLQFGVMGSVYAQLVLGIDNPRVGILNIGSESGKGNKLVLDSYKLLEEAPINFIGNIEGRDIPFGRADVIVCDGFVGNVILKFAEGLGEGLHQILKSAIKRRGPLGTLGGLLLSGAFSDLKKKVDYTEYGGAPMLGVRGICIKSHGSSDAKAIKNGIRIAGEAVRKDVLGNIQRRLKES
ncbi:MAG: phosphate acyltransferase PlsX [bacterium]